MTPRRLLTIYFVVAGLYSLAASLTWGINTLFLLDAGLDIFGVFVASAAFTASAVLFEIPTGVVADAWGRRLSFLLSTAVLACGTVAYLVLAEMRAGLPAFCVVSAVIGLGFTFYSGAVEAWLVDGLKAVRYPGLLDQVFSRGALVTGAAMVVGTVAGGILGQIDLSLPYIVRTALLVLCFGVAAAVMRDVGFTGRAVRARDVPAAMKEIAQAGVTFGWRRRSVRLLMATSFIEIGFLSWAFYAWQPYFIDLLEREVVWAMGIFAALVSLATMAGNASVEVLGRLADRRTTLLIGAAVLEGGAIIGVGLADSFWLAAGLYLLGSAAMGIIFPIKQAYMHQVIPSAQRATVVSLDSMVGNSGAVLGQVGLGHLSQNRSIPVGFVAGGAGTLLVVPVLWALRRLGEPADRLTAELGRAGAKVPSAAQGLPGVAAVDSTSHSGRDLPEL